MWEGREKGRGLLSAFFDYYEILFEVGFFSTIAVFSFHITWYSGFSGL